MELYIAGGCGEHGRNCFYITDKFNSIIIDCGMMTGNKDCYPHITPAQIRNASYLFLTHSHADHSGALPWLLQEGFKGEIVMTQATANQLENMRIPNKIIIIDKATDPELKLLLNSWLGLTWGRSGHCAGSCWYLIDFGENTILCSGDYVEGSLAYQCTIIKDITADLALLDNAYTQNSLSNAELRHQFCEEAAKLLNERPILVLPVPKYGRGLDMLLALHELFQKYDLYVDAHLINQLQNLYTYTDWLQADAIAKLQNLTYQSFNYTQKLESGIYFISDPQVKIPANYRMLCSLQDKGFALASGHLENNSNAQKLADNNLLIQAFYPTHGSDQQIENLVARNYFTKIITTHSDANNSPAHIEFGK